MQEFVARRCWSKNAAHTPEDTYRKAKGKKNATAVSSIARRGEKWIRWQLALAIDLLLLLTVSRWIELDQLLDMYSPSLTTGKAMVSKRGTEADALNAMHNEKDDELLWQRFLGTASRKVVPLTVGFFTDTSTCLIFLGLLQMCISRHPINERRGLLWCVAVARHFCGCVFVFGSLLLAVADVVFLSIVGTHINGDIISLGVEYAYTIRSTVERNVLEQARAASSRSSNNGHSNGATAISDEPHQELGTCWWFGIALITFIFFVWVWHIILMKLTGWAVGFFRQYTLRTDGSLLLMSRRDTFLYLFVLPSLVLFIVVQVALLGDEVSFYSSSSPLLFLRGAELGATNVFLFCAQEFASGCALYWASFWHHGLSIAEFVSMAKKDRRLLFLNTNFDFDYATQPCKRNGEALGTNFLLRAPCGWDRTASSSSTVGAKKQMPQYTRPSVIHRRSSHSGHASNSKSEKPSIAGVVLVVLESTRATAISGLYEAAEHYDRQRSLPDRRTFVGSNPFVSSQRPSFSFLAHLAHRPGATVARYAFPTMPNTNKAMLEILCGLTPLLDTTWGEFASPTSFPSSRSDTTGGLGSSSSGRSGSYLEYVREECLARRLSQDLGWRTFFATPAFIDAASTHQTVQAAAGFETLLGATELQGACREALLREEPLCAHFHPSSSIFTALDSMSKKPLHHKKAHCLNTLLMEEDAAVQKKRRESIENTSHSDHRENSEESPTLRSALLRHFIELATAFVRSHPKNNFSGKVVSSPCGWIAAPLLEEDHGFESFTALRRCIASACPWADMDEDSSSLSNTRFKDESQKRALTSRRWGSSTVSDEMLVEPALDFIRGAISSDELSQPNGTPFFATLLTTGTHHPYSQHSLSSCLSAFSPTVPYTKMRSPSSSSNDEAVKNLVYDTSPIYSAAIKKSDAMLKMLVDGLDKMILPETLTPVSSRTLLIVVGDHGEAFGEGGHWQHGSCVHVACLQVPLVVVDPLQSRLRRRMYQLKKHEQSLAEKARLMHMPSNVTDTAVDTIRWREGVTSHADIMPTILDWADLRMVNCSTAGTIIRRGVSLLRASPPLSLQKYNVSVALRTLLPVYSFFNPQVCGVLLLESSMISPVSSRPANKTTPENEKRKINLVQIVIEHSRSRFARHAYIKGSNSPSSVLLMRTQMDTAPLNQSEAWQRTLQQGRVAVRFAYGNLFSGGVFS